MEWKSGPSPFKSATFATEIKKNAIINIKTNKALCTPVKPATFATFATDKAIGILMEWK